MIACPLCQSAIDPPATACPRCRADVSLLADRADEVRAFLECADACPKADEVAASLRAYLEVLAVDPTNAEARLALAPVLAALPRTTKNGSGWRGAVVVIGVGIAALLVGLYIGISF